MGTEKPECIMGGDIANVCDQLIEWFGCLDEFTNEQCYESCNCSEEDVDDYRSRASNRAMAVMFPVGAIILMYIILQWYISRQSAAEGTLSKMLDSNLTTTAVDVETPAQ